MGGKGGLFHAETEVPTVHIYESPVPPPLDRNRDLGLGADQTWGGNSYFPQFALRWRKCGPLVNVSSDKSPWIICLNDWRWSHRSHPDLESRVTIFITTTVRFDIVRSSVKLHTAHADHYPLLYSPALSADHWRLSVYRCVTCVLRDSFPFENDCSVLIRLRRRFGFEDFSPVSRPTGSLLFRCSLLFFSRWWLGIARRGSTGA